MPHHPLKLSRNHFKLMDLYILYVFQLIIIIGQWNPLTLLVGMQTSTATMENSVEIP